MFSPYCAPRNDDTSQKFDGTKSSPVTSLQSLKEGSNQSMTYIFF